MLDYGCLKPVCEFGNTRWWRRKGIWAVRQVCQSKRDQSGSSEVCKNTRPSLAMWPAHFFPLTLIAVISFMFLVRYYKFITFFKKVPYTLIQSIDRRNRMQSQWISASKPKSDDLQPQRNSTTVDYCVN
jgi:hypothetical protein